MEPVQKTSHPGRGGISGPVLCTLWPKNRFYAAAIKTRSARPAEKTLGEGDAYCFSLSSSGDGRVKNQGAQETENEWVGKKSRTKSKSTDGLDLCNLKKTEGDRRKPRRVEKRSCEKRIVCVAAKAGMSRWAVGKDKKELKHLGGGKVFLSKGRRKFTRGKKSYILLEPKKRWRQ